MTNNKNITILRLYLWLIGSSLFVQGMVSMVVTTANLHLPTLIHKLIITDPLHSFIHICWGLGISLLLARRISKPRLVRLALSYGVFILILGFTGTFIHHPFGMQLGRGENVFHFLSSSVALILGIRVMKEL
ncbi:hypothetical protein WA1_38955 [Scytonema hofmannii PCC 7110]|uniref:DUF4383 domain-containing protein n=1 Tax=Scytonema hofmannii PCC 7110 TaxID=128403 RepID=A0A139X0Z9_9CYAN|nr:hypothetical protein [Scytonema hofmannii]KYC38313.1 hypothetical protein WA1_38955 [Scytonema hofmannii PCC 7110]